MEEQEILNLLEDAAPPSGLPTGFADGVMVALETKVRAQQRRRMAWMAVSGVFGLLVLAGAAALFPAVWFYVKLAVLPILLVALVQYLDVQLVQMPMLKKQLDG